MGNKNSSSNFKRKSSNTLLNEPEPRNSNNENEGTEQKYYLPNDSNDIDGLHLQHFLKKHLYHNNFSVPIEDNLIQGGYKVLDVGCGPGTWLLDLSVKYKDSYFFGLDIMPVYPSEIKPKNLEFIESDIFKGLPFPDNVFDFVHQGSMLFAVKADQWNFVISELVRVTKPGGFIELVEFTGSQNNGPILTKLHDTYHDSCSQRGVDLSLSCHLDKILESQVNITKVHKDTKSFLMGPNGGKLGMVMQDVFLIYHASKASIEHLSLKQGISNEEVKSMLNDIVKELEETKPELNISRFWTQKNP
ncbi:16098_t:CDS:2 [Funneliformis geosporum]|uniref:7341_t:CDS:1 n=1 Tax=Funneliformis geosporum TaxID=1117311 RepID=A0A9W4SIX3_9GLOM|nr:16098_t:CDS:2 [Funneliformis geosporum]CAI2170733.1 7341_t:CDS:2 [Funneliformis geosporum]